ncbi:ABC transporter ATP-binding protein [Actibacterium pelagium]|uniref:ABC transporter ATP-binding protein n=1 Tax=Actibacterium pelagium TaxID=2029103 RepID=A0A917ABR6_9RHOB|nr:ABC transporter ATP-binding protein [Actibacterium pelagium]GGE39606.1 ABC transporter ATP-binding protein [Actibacterium pelagium]
MKTLLSALSLIDRRERRQIIPMCILVLVVAAFELLSVLAIVPFLGVLGNLRNGEFSPFVEKVLSYLGLQSPEEALITFGGFFVALLVVAALARSFGAYALNRFVQTLWCNLATRLLETYLRQPYAFFLDRNSSDLSKRILTECQVVMQNVFVPAARILEFGAVFLAMVALIIATEPLVAATMAGTIIVTYLLLFSLVKGFVRRIGELRVQESQRTFRATSDAFGAIKEIKLRRQERNSLDRFAEPANALAQYTTLFVVAGRLPKYAVELVAIGGLMVFVVFTLKNGGEGAEDVRTLQLVGLYALAGYRMLPALQAIYEAATQLRFAGPAVEELLDDLQQRDELPEVASSGRTMNPLRGTLILDQVSFQYPGDTTRGGLHDISVRVEPGQSVGVVGTTGAGKTTLVDIMLGLLKPTTGKVFINETELSENSVERWQSQIAYVPQDIFLFDTTVAENIAMGQARDAIDLERVKSSARAAQIAEFIETELPAGYETFVGEKGARLSGGQRQRIGLARALYLQPCTLILDEATNALDTATENKVLDMIATLGEGTTVIQIAHRLSTIRRCDQVIVLDQGRLVGQGTYDELKQTNDVFQNLLANN